MATVHISPSINEALIASELVDSVKPGSRVTDPGETICALRRQARQTPRDIELRTAEIVSKTGDSSFLVSHSQLHQIETENSVPGIFKLCGLAACLQISLEEMLRIFGIDLALLKEQYGLELTSGSDLNAEPTGLPSLQQLTSRFRLTTLVSREIQEKLLLPYLAPGSENRQRYTFGVIGQDDGNETDFIPPGTLVQIDRKYPTSAPSTKSQVRPIYFVWYDDGYVCSWCELEGKDLTVIPFSPERKLLRLRVPRDADIIGKVVGVIRFLDCE